MTSTRTRQRVGSDGTLEQRPFVLVVHRSAALRNTLLSALDFEGFDVMTMVDDEEAAVIVKYIPPQAIVVDRRLVNSTGSECASAARRAHIPMIAFDDAAMMPPVEWCLDIGIQPVGWEGGVARLLQMLHEVAVPAVHALSSIA